MAYKKLDMFDFDGTLFNSPQNTEANQKLYEKVTGLPWLISKEQSREFSKKLGRFVPMRRGWFGKAETLEPPLVPDPAPADWFIKDVCEAFLASKADQETLTLIVTGRHVGLKKQVLRICKDGKLLKVQTKHGKDGKVYLESADDWAQIYFLGDNGPMSGDNKPAETLPWKLWLMEQFLDLHPSIEMVEIWEDRDEHVAEFLKLEDEWAMPVLVRHVK